MNTPRDFFLHSGQIVYGVWIKSLGFGFILPICFFSDSDCNVLHIPWFALSLGEYFKSSGWVYGGMDGGRTRNLRSDSAML